MSRVRYRAPIPGRHEDWGDVSTHIVRFRDAMVAALVANCRRSDVPMTWSEAAAAMHRVADEERVNRTGAA